MTRRGADRGVTVCSGDLSPRVYTPSACTSSCAHLNVCVCVCENNNCDISAAAHLRGPGELALKPADYLGAPRGSPITPTQAPAVKHILLTRSLFLSSLSVLLLCFHFAS